MFVGLFLFIPASCVTFHAITENFVSGENVISPKKTPPPLMLQKGRRLIHPAYSYTARLPPM